MLKRLLTIMFLAAAVSAGAFNVYMRTGGEAYSSADIARIALNADRGATIFFTDGTETTLNAGEFEAITFAESSGNPAIDREPTGIVINNGFITAPTSATVYDAAGRKVASSKSGRIDIGGFENGVYVIVYGNKSEKFILR